MLIFCLFHQSLRVKTIMGPCLTVNETIMAVQVVLVESQDTGKWTHLVCSYELQGCRKCIMNMQTTRNISASTSKQSSQRRCIHPECISEESVGRWLCFFMEQYGRVATVREKYLENEIFSRSGKSQGICGRLGKFRMDLESQGKVKEFENKWLWQADFRKFIYSVQEGKRCTFS